MIEKTPDERYASYSRMVTSDHYDRLNHKKYPESWSWIGSASYSRMVTRTGKTNTRIDPSGVDPPTLKSVSIKKYISKYCGLHLGLKHGERRVFILPVGSDDLWGFPLMQPLKIRLLSSSSDYFRHNLDVSVTSWINFHTRFESNYDDEKSKDKVFGSWQPEQLSCRTARNVDVRSMILLSASTNSQVESCIYSKANYAISLHIIYIYI